MPATLVHHPRSPRERPLVLLIQDNSADLMLYEVVLESSVDVLAVTRGRDACGLAARTRPDAIVLDVVLSGVDGLTVCERLRFSSATASIPLVVLTGDDNAFARAQNRQSILSAVLMKPCSPDRLLAAVHGAVRKGSEGSGGRSGFRLQGLKI